MPSGLLCRLADGIRIIHEGLEKLWVEAIPQAAHDIQSLTAGICFPVGTVCGQGFKHVTDADQLGDVRYLFAREAEGIAGAVIPFMMELGCKQYLLRHLIAGKDFEARAEWLRISSNSLWLRISFLFKIFRFIPVLPISWNKPAKYTILASISQSAYFINSAE